MRFLSKTLPNLTPLVAVQLLFLAACSKSPDLWGGPQISQPRNQLTVKQLMADTLQPYVDYSFYSMPAWATPAPLEFSGEIAIAQTTLQYDINRPFYEGENRFPQLNIQFTSYNGALIPLQQEFLLNAPGAADSWNILVGPGRTWQEPEDGDWCRASFPLSLTDSYIGQVKNCVATFVYNADSISNICLQCSQETADYNDGSVGNIRATLPAKFQSKPLPNAALAIDEYLHNQANLLPVEPLSTIDANQELANYFSKTKYTSAPTSLGALVYNNTLYLHPPATRHGDYPYPNEMRHGVYSVSKTLTGALALFYFAERYGIEIMQESVAQYVPALSNLPEWQGVTFSQTLNMVSGTNGGEDAERMLNTMVTPRTSAEIIANIATLGATEYQAGEAFNYASTNLFVLSCALQNYVQQKEGGTTNYWQLVQNNVLNPLGISDFTLLKTVETDSLQAIPLLGYGALPTAQHAAKIALLFSNFGQYNGQQLISKELCKQALQPNYWDGISTNNDDRGNTYKHSFWWSTQKVNNCKIEVAYMLGYGANYIWFFPNSVIAIRFMDEYTMNFKPLVKAVEQIESSCQ